VPKRFSRQWVQRKVPQMDSTEFHAMFHEAATRGWDEDELRQLAQLGRKDRLADHLAPSPSDQSRLANATGQGDARQAR
jgi:hypothetical protein